MNHQHSTDLIRISNARACHLCRHSATTVSIAFDAPVHAPCAWFMSLHAALISGEVIALRTRIVMTVVRLAGALGLYTERSPEVART